MTLITISHLSASTRPQTLPGALHSLNGQNNNLGKCGLVADVDRFSLNSNLSGSSPHSSLTSPLSTDYNGSQASICCGSSPVSPTSDSCALLAPQKYQNNNNNHHHNHNNHHHHHPHPALHRQALSLTQPPGQPPVRRLSRSEHRQSLSDLGYGKIESYARLQRLGKGTYATVYMGRSRLSNDLVALKEILKEHDEGAPCTAIREVSLLRLLRHNNIVTLHDICHTPKKLTLVFEYVGPDLYAYMKENNHLLSIHNVRVSSFTLSLSLSLHLTLLISADDRAQKLSRFAVDLYLRGCHEANCAC